MISASAQKVEGFGSRADTLRSALDPRDKTTPHESSAAIG
jgi:hypothetical protein